MSRAEWERVREARRRLAQVLADEQRAWQRLRELRASAERWHQRARLAAERGLAELLVEAQRRATQQEQLAAQAMEHWRAIEAEVQRLRQELRLAEAGPPPAPVAGTDEQVAARLGALEREAELDRQLTELKGRLRAQPAEKE